MGLNCVNLCTDKRWPFETEESTQKYFFEKVQLYKVRLNTVKFGYTPKHNVSESSVMLDDILDFLPY